RSQVEIFEFGLFERGLDLRLQFRREFALLRNRRQHRLAPVFQLAEVFQLLLDVADLHFVEIAGGLLAVARNERHGGAPVEQFDDSQHPLQRDRQKLGDVNEYGGGKSLEFSHDPVELSWWHKALPCASERQLGGDRPGGLSYRYFTKRTALPRSL